MIFPLSFFISPKIELIVVLFPAPFSPISPTMLPDGMLKEMLSNTKLLYFFVKPVSVNAVFILNPPHTTATEVQSICLTLFRLTEQSQWRH